MTTNGSKPTQSSDDTDQANRPRLPIARPVKCYYIDELGFYRHLDPDQRQYVCSNVSAATIRRPLQTASTSSSNGFNRLKQHLQEEQRISAADGGLEICFKAMRRDLGISHFDKVDDYAKWKGDWDEFMRVKLVSRQPVTLNRDLKTRVRSGIPHDYRCKVWSALIRMRTRAIRAQFGDEVYETIVRDFISKIGVPNYASREQDSNNNNNNNRRTNNKDILSNNQKNTTNSQPVTGNGSSYLGGDFINSKQAQYNQRKGQRTRVPETFIEKCFKQIELDLLRTLPNNMHFEDPNSRGIKRVRRVLRAYACFNQSVGYCQGMNRLAAMALLVLPEEQAFWCLVAIIQCIMPKDYYLKPWLAQVDCCVLSDLLEKKMPKLHKHLMHNDIQLTLFTWFFTIFVDGFRPELMLRIWDCFLLEGDKVLFRFALAILYISQDELLQMSDFSSMSAHLGRIVSTRQLDVEHLFEIAFNTMNPLSSATIESRRQFHRNKLQSIIDE